MEIGSPLDGVLIRQFVNGIMRIRVVVQHVLVNESMRLNGRCSMTTL